MSRLIVEEARGVEALNALRAEWQALFQASGAPPFLSWEWVTAWQQWFGPDRTPRIFCARKDGELVGLLPLGEETRQIFGLTLRRLSFLGEGLGGADYLDVLARPEAKEESAEAIFEYLRREASFDVLELEGMAEDSPSLPIIARHFGASTRFKQRVAACGVCPRLELEGSWEEVLKGSKRATNFKRRYNYLRKLESFERRVITEPEQAVAAFDRFLALHEQRWAGQGGSDAMGPAAVKAFHRDVVERLACAGLLRFEELWVEGECRASLYGIETGGGFYFYQTGVDPEWSKRSVGLVQLGLSIQDAMSRGLQLYDFLRGAETYKFDWATGTRCTVTVQASARSLPATLFVARAQAKVAARAAAQAVLPERAAELWRRVRRARASQPEQNEWPATPDVLVQPGEG